MASLWKKIEYNEDEEEEEEEKKNCNLNLAFNYIYTRRSVYGRVKGTS